MPGHEDELDPILLALGPGDVVESSRASQHEAPPMLQKTAQSGFDAVVVDREGRTVALIKVRTHAAVPWSAILSDHMSRVPEPIPFVVAADLERIRVYAANLEKPIVQLNTAEALQEYEPEFSSKRIFEPYLLTLVEAWIRDHAYHWKSDSPFGAADLARAGLLDALAGGTTERFGE